MKTYSTKNSMWTSAMFLFRWIWWIWFFLLFWFSHRNIYHNSFCFSINWRFFLKNVCSPIKFNLRNCFFLQSSLRWLGMNHWCYKCICILRGRTSWPFWRIRYWIYKNHFEIKIWSEIEKHRTFHIVISLIKNNLICEENITDNFH